MTHNQSRVKGIPKGQPLLTYGTTQHLCRSVSRIMTYNPTPDTRRDLISKTSFLWYILEVSNQSLQMCRIGHF